MNRAVTTVLTVVLLLFVVVMISKGLQRSNTADGLSRDINNAASETAEAVNDAGRAVGDALD